MFNVWYQLVLWLGLLLVLAAVSRVPLRYNLRNLTVRWKTTLMTAVAFTVVIALLTVMMAFVNGMDRLTEAAPASRATCWCWPTGPPTRCSATSRLGDLGQSRICPTSNAATAARWPAARPFWSSTSRSSTTRTDGPKRRFLQLRGIEDPLRSAHVHGLELLPGGSWFSEAGVQELPAGDGRATPTAVIQACSARASPTSWAAIATRRNWPRPAIASGSTWAIPSLGDRTWIVVGVLESVGSTFNSGDLGEAVAGGLAVRQRHLHDARAPPPRTPRRPRS